MGLMQRNGSLVQVGGSLTEDPLCCLCPAPGCRLFFVDFTSVDAEFPLIPALGIPNDVWCLIANWVAWGTPGATNGPPNFVDDNIALAYWYYESCCDAAPQANEIESAFQTWLQDNFPLLSSSSFDRCFADECELTHYINLTVKDAGIAGDPGDIFLAYRRAKLDCVENR